jgi:hypothetical protein
MVTCIVLSYLLVPLTRKHPQLLRTLPRPDDRLAPPRVLFFFASRL